MSSIKKSHRDFVGGMNPGEFWYAAGGSGRLWPLAGASGRAANVVSGGRIGEIIRRRVMKMLGPLASERHMSASTTYVVVTTCCFVTAFMFAQAAGGNSKVRTSAERNMGVGILDTHHVASCGLSSVSVTTEADSSSPQIRTTSDTTAMSHEAWSVFHSSLLAREVDREDGARFSRGRDFNGATVRYYNLPRDVQT